MFNYWMLEQTELREQNTHINYLFGGRSEHFKGHREVLRKKIKDAQSGSNDFTFKHVQTSLFQNNLFFLDHFTIPGGTSERYLQCPRLSSKSKTNPAQKTS